LMSITQRQSCNEMLSAPEWTWRNWPLNMVIKRGGQD
jgi:hypothetical protein